MSIRELPSEKKKRLIAKQLAKGITTGLMISSALLPIFTGCGPTTPITSPLPGESGKPGKPTPDTAIPPQADLLKLMQQPTDYRKNEVESKYDDSSVIYHRRVLTETIMRYYDKASGGKELVSSLFGGDPMDQMFYSDGKIIYLGRAIDIKNDKFRLFNFEIKLNDSNKNIVENYIANADKHFKEDFFVAACHLIENADPSCEEHIDSPEANIDMFPKYDKQLVTDLQVKYSNPYIRPPSKPFFYNGTLISFVDNMNIYVEIKLVNDEFVTASNNADDSFNLYEKFGINDSLHTPPTYQK